MSDYASARTDVVFMGGGSNRVTIPATPFAKRGGTGTGGATSVPCAKCILHVPSGNSGTVRMSIGAVPTSTTGIPLAKEGTSSTARLEIAIDDLNKLYFLGTSENDVVDILYLR